jgi:hypothetical protein
MRLWKNAQIDAQTNLSKRIGRFYREKVAQKFELLLLFWFNLPQINNRPIGEKSPNRWKFAQSSRTVAWQGAALFPWIRQVLWSGVQGCQIFLSAWYQNRKKLPKLYQMYQINIPNVHKIFQMAVKYISIFQYKALQNFPKFGFLVLK